MSKPNATPIFVPFEDGTKKRIKFGPAAFRRIEKELDSGSVMLLMMPDRKLSREEQGRALLSKMGWNTIIAFIWAGTHTCGGILTIDEVADSLVVEKMSEYIKAIQEAFVQTLGEKAQQAVDAARKEAEAIEAGEPIEVDPTAVELPA